MSEEKTSKANAHGEAYEASGTVIKGSGNSENAEDDFSKTASERGLQDEISVEDLQGNRYLRKDVVKTLLCYKKDSRNFFIGGLLRNCSRMNRNIADRWYSWTKEMMENIDRNEEKIRSIIAKNSHSKIQAVCKSSGDEFWCLTTKGKLKALLGSLRQIEKLINSEMGLSTRWGRIKSRGAFKTKFHEGCNVMRRKFGRDRVYDELDYFNYKNMRWDEHYEKVSKRRELDDLYDKNYL